MNPQSVGDVATCALFAAHMRDSVVNCVRLVVGYHSRWHGSWVHNTGWDCCTLHSTVHYWWNNGGLSLIIVLMGPPPAM